MKTIAFIILMLTMFLTVPMVGHAIEGETEPYQLAILHPAQFVPRNASIRGVRFNFIYGINKDVSGVDFGLFNQVDDEQRGLQFGIVNSSFKTNGVQIGIINNTQYLNGIQIGLLNIHNEGGFRFMPGINFAF